MEKAFRKKLILIIIITTGIGGGIGVFSFFLYKYFQKHKLPNQKTKQHNLKFDIPQNQNLQSQYKNEPKIQLMNEHENFQPRTVPPQNQQSQIFVDYLNKPATNTNIQSKPQFIGFDKSSKNKNDQLPFEQKNSPSTKGNQNESILLQLQIKQHENNLNKNIKNRPLNSLIKEQEKATQNNVDLNSSAKLQGNSSQNDKIDKEKKLQIAKEETGDQSKSSTSQPVEQIIQNGPTDSLLINSQYLLHPQFIPNDLSVDKSIEDSNLLFNNAQNNFNKNINDNLSLETKNQQNLADEKPKESKLEDYFVVIEEKFPRKNTEYQNEFPKQEPLEEQIENSIETIKPIINTSNQKNQNLDDYKYSPPFTLNPKSNNPLLNQDISQAKISKDPIVSTKNFKSNNQPTTIINQSNLFPEISQETNSVENGNYFKSQQQSIKPDYEQQPLIVTKPELKNQLISDLIKSIQNNPSTLKSPKFQQFILDINNPTKSTLSQEYYLKKLQEISSLVLQSENLQNSLIKEVNVQTKFDQEEKYNFIYFIYGLLISDLLNQQQQIWFFEKTLEPFLEDVLYDENLILELFVPLTRFILTKADALEYLGDFLINQIYFLMFRNYQFKHQEVILQFLKISEIKKVSDFQEYMYSKKLNQEGEIELNFLDENYQIPDEIYQLLNELLFELLTSFHTKLHGKYMHIQLYIYLNGENLDEMRSKQIINKLYYDFLSITFNSQQFKNFYIYNYLYEQIFLNINLLDFEDQSLAKEKLIEISELCKNSSFIANKFIQFNKLFIFLLKYHYLIPSKEIVNDFVSLLKERFKQEREFIQNTKLSSNYEELVQQLEIQDYYTEQDYQYHYFPIPGIQIMCELFKHVNNLTEQNQNMIIEQLQFYQQNFDKMYYNLKSQYAYLILKMDRNYPKYIIFFNNENQLKLSKILEFFQHQNSIYKFQEKFENIEEIINKYNYINSLNSEQEINEFQQDMISFMHSVLGDPNYIQIEEIQKIQEIKHPLFLMNYYLASSIAMPLFANVVFFAENVKQINKRFPFSESLRDLIILIEIDYQNQLIREKKHILEDIQFD